MTDNKHVAEFYEALELLQRITLILDRNTAIEKSGGRPTANQRAALRRALAKSRKLLGIQQPTRN